MSVWEGGRRNRHERLRVKESQIKRGLTVKAPLALGSCERENMHGCMPEAQDSHLTQRGHDLGKQTNKYKNKFIKAADI